MAKAITFTQAQLEEARRALDALPDLSRDKIGKPELLESLKEQIMTLANAKGYTQAEIKSALETVGVTVTAKAISELLKVSSKRGKAKKPANTTES